MKEESVSLKSLTSIVIGIIHDVTLYYTSKYNVAAKRRNMSIMNMMRSMSKSKDLSKYLCGEAVTTTIYILNICPTWDLWGEKAWSCPNQVSIILEFLGQYAR